MKKVSVSNNLHYIFPINKNSTYMNENKTIIVNVY